jgi:hypothetical protein
MENPAYGCPDINSTRDRTMFTLELYIIVVRFGDSRTPF